MALIKCMECDRTISYPGPTTVVIGITNLREESKPGIGDDQHLISPRTEDFTPVRILTLECGAGHRHNYTI